MADSNDSKLAGAPVAQAGIDPMMPPPTHAAALPSARESGKGSLCPHEYLCPITGVLMTDPVLLVETGHTFEKWAIERWFAQGKRTCPLTGVTLTSIQVSPNLTLRKLIQDWTARHPTHSAAIQANAPSREVPSQPNAGSGQPSEGWLTREVSPQPNPGFGLSSEQWLLNSLPRQSALPNPHPVLGRNTLWAEPPSAVPPAARALPSAHHLERLINQWRPRQAPEIPLLPADDDEPLSASPPVPLGEGGDVIDAHPELSLASEFEAIGPLPQEMVVLAHVAAPESGARVPLDLVAVLDVSGSMAGERLALVKETMLFVISQLQPSDRLAIVAFCDRAQRPIRLTRATEQGKERLKVAVQGLRAGGGTSIAFGLALGLHVLTSRREKNHVACMFLLSDGLDSFQPQRADFAAQNQNLLTSAARDSISVHTFGYGRDHDDQILDSIAEGTNGTFTFIRTNSEVTAAVAQTLGGALSVAVQATTVELTASPGVAIMSVKAGAYEASVDDAKASATIDLKDMYSGETRDVLISITVPAAGDDRLAPTELLLGRLHYTTPPGREVASRSLLVTLSVARGEGPEGTGPNMDVDIQRNRLRAAEAMRVGDRLAGEGRLELARASIAAALEAIRGSISAQTPACVATMEDLEQVQRGFASKLEYQREGAKVVKSSTRRHTTQRSTYSSVEGFADAPRNSEFDQYASAAALQMRKVATQSRAQR